MNNYSKYQSVAEIALDLVNDIYRGISDLNAWDFVVKRLVEVTGSRKGLLTYRSATSADMMPSQSPLLAPRLINISPVQIDQYFSHYYKIDPWTEHEINIKYQDVIRFSDYVPVELLKQSVFYKEFLSTLLVEDGFALNVAKGPHAWVVLNLLIGNKPSMDPDDIRKLLLLLTPHLQRAFQAAIELALVKTSNTELSTLLDQNRESIILLNNDGKIVYLNTKARQIIAQNEELYIKNDILKCRSYTANEEFLQLIHNVVNRKNKKSCHMALPRKLGNKPLQLYFTPLYQTKGTSTSNRSHIIVFITDPATQPGNLLIKVKQLYKLTNSEAKLVESLVHGVNLKEYAKNNKISFNTARWHLRNVFIKTGVSNQPELIKLVMTIPGLFD